MSFPVNNKKTGEAAIGAVVEVAETEEQLVMLISAFILFFSATAGKKFNPPVFSAACVETWHNLLTAQLQEQQDEATEEFMRPRSEDPPAEEQTLEELPWWNCPCGHPVEEGTLCTHCGTLDQHEEKENNQSTEVDDPLAYRDDEEQAARIQLREEEEE